MSLTTTPTNDLTLVVADTISLAGAEIAAFDPVSKRLFVTSGDGLQIVDMSDPTALSLVTTIDFTGAPFNFTNDLNSVAVKNGVVAVAVAADPKTDAGKVFFLDANGASLGQATVGSLPDMVTFTPDGSKVLVANEAEGSEPNSATNPEGSISIITVADFSVQTASFTAFNSQEAALRDAGVRIFPGNSVAQDVEPEYIAVSEDGATALITLQENNAIAILDIATATITEIVPLGLKDFSGLLADFSDRELPGNVNAIQLETGNPVFGMYMPDAIASFVGADGNQYYVIANEGDDRDDFLNPDETIRVASGSYDLDNTVFPNEAALKANAELGRLTVSNVSGLRGDTDNDGDIDQIIAYGARSFSILDANGTIVFDSGSQIEEVVAATGFQSAGGNYPPDRDDNKGSEPEGVTVGTINGKTFAFVGLERANGVMVYDITDPSQPTFTQFVSNAGDVSPEGLTFIGIADSPTNEELLVVANEVSNTLTVFEVTSEVDFTLQLLHFADGEAGLLASETAPLLAALVDAFDDVYANTLILAGGDNFLPGPFAAAGTDATVAATHSRGNNPFAADIEIHNRIGVEASTIGNHEFDFGTNAFSDAINDTTFPYLSANLDFSGDSAISGRFQETVGVGGLEDAATLARKIVPSAVVTKGGEQIGLVGATTQIVEGISSTGNVEVKGFGEGDERNDMVLLAAQLQPVIDDLIAQGVNKIIVMAHLQQIALEKELAGLLTGVDIILAAGSNTRLGDADDEAVAFTGHAANFADTYPLQITDAAGKTTLIVNTDNEYTYLGRLVVDFDENGDVIAASIADNVAINGAYAATEDNVAEAWAASGGLDAAFAEGTKAEQVEDITDAVQSVISAKDGAVFGFTNVYLEGERNFVRNQETNLGNITADANAEAARNATGETFMVSLKNGGGIRAAIGSVEVGSGEKNPPLANDAVGKPTGGVSDLDIENSLRFNNGLMVFDTTAEGLLAILNHGVAVLGGQGRFPQIGGVSFSFDPNGVPGARVQDVVITDANGVSVVIADNGRIVSGAPATISVVTLNFLANGGDGYPIKANGENFRFLLNDGTLSAPVDEALNFTASSVVPANILGEQQAMEEFMAANHATQQTAFNEADTAIEDDTRIQNTSVRDDTVISDAIPAITGAKGSDTLTGTDAQDTLDGGKGRDTMAGGEGDDTYLVDSRGDVVVEEAGEGEDTVQTTKSFVLGDNVENLEYVGTGAAKLTGNVLANTIEGGAGNDKLFGFGGNDTLIGGAGNDRINADGGIDTMTGGADADRFIFIDAIEIGNGVGTRDIITDFEAGVDRIDLKKIDANLTAGGNQKFAFIGAADFTGLAGQLNVLVDGTDAIVQGDLDGDSIADFQLQLDDVTASSLSATDFIL